MKDSQDWLVAVTGLYTDYYANKITLGELSDGVNSIVREHFLKEAMEILDTPALSKAINAKINELETITYHKHHYVRKTGLKRAIKDTTRQELRNKFNNKYKED